MLPKLKGIATNQLGWIILAAFVGWSMYARGKADERAEQLRSELAVQKVEVVALQTQILAKDSLVAQMQEYVDTVQSRVVIIDQTVQPQVDSAIASLRSSLDSTQQQALQVVVAGFEARLEARDSSIAALSRLVVQQQAAIVTRDSLFHAMQRLQQITFDAYEAERKRNQHNLLERASQLLPVVASAIILVKGID